MFSIGKITGVHGLDGNLKVWSFAHSIETFSPGCSVFLIRSGKESKKKFTILKALPHKKGILLLLKGIENRNLAENLIGYEICIERDQLPALDEDNWYWQDLVGLDVFDHTRGFIGKVKELFATGAHDILVVVRNQNETLVPMHKHFVKSIDANKKIITVNLPEEY